METSLQPEGFPPSPASLFPRDRSAHRAALDAALACLDRVAAEGGRPYGGASPERLAELVAAVDVLPEQGRPLADVLADLGDLAVRHAVDPADPACAGHLHCPPLNAALAADVLVGARNPSLDSWDQAPVATHLEAHLVRTLCELAGFPRGDGVFTPGGTQSNLMGLLLARDRTLRRLGRDAAAQGVGRDGERLRLLCSTLAHFTVRRSAAVLGLGEEAVVEVGVDDAGRMRADALDDVLGRLRRQGAVPAAIVATAGTTDLGSIDPLPAIADRARRRGVWLHVDAAYGGGLLLSRRHRHLLHGLDHADSVGLDFHKLLWQPIACGVFLVRDGASLAPLDVEVAYLNAEPDGGGAWRMPHLVGKSLQTTRRFDALKVLVSLQTLGREALETLLEHLMALARHAADLIDANPRLALVQRPALTSVLFRYRPSPDDPGLSDRLNTAIRLRLLAAGAAVVGRTEIGGRAHLKLTLLNPAATTADVADLLAAVAAAGDELAAAS